MAIPCSVNCAICDSSSAIARRHYLVRDLVWDGRRTEFGSGDRFDRLDAPFANALIDRIVNIVYV